MDQDVEQSSDEDEEFTTPVIKATSVYDLISTNQYDAKIKLHVKSLDNLLHGGIRIRGVTEVYGEAGSGKTQLCLHLCLAVQLPKALGGLGAKALYISTEGPIPIKRLEAMAAALHEQDRFSGKIKNVDFLANVKCICVHDSNELLQLFEKRLEHLVKTEKIGVVIIDSVAAAFRVEDKYIQRATNFRQMVQKLIHLSWRYDFGIVCVNQVTSVPGDAEEFSPALGMAWANLVTTRLHIYKDGSLLTQKNAANVYDQRRVMRVIWAPHLPIDQATFFITAKGLA